MFEEPIFILYKYKNPLFSLSEKQEKSIVTKLGKNKYVFVGWVWTNNMSASQPTVCDVPESRPVSIWTSLPSRLRCQVQSKEAW